MDELKSFLDAKADKYNNASFIENDPVSLPHQFAGKQDREIIGLFAALLAWGQRKTIISKCQDLVRRFGGEPYRFIREYGDEDLKGLTGFAHRTFNDTDLYYFVDFLHRHYTRHATLEDAFLHEGVFHSVEDSLIRFEQTFFDSPDAPPRTRKHVATPRRNSACKRMNMFLRWMVRADNRGVDFGIWNRIPQSALICPIDLHVDRAARKLGLITRKQTDWNTALQLTANLRELDAADPVKYDFALFGMSLENDW